MSGKIDLTEETPVVIKNETEFSIGFLIWISVLAIVITAVNVSVPFIMKKIGYVEQAYQPYQFIITPPFIALQARTIVDGINMFSGLEPVHNLYNNFWILCNILLFYLIPPVLFLGGVIEYYLNKNIDKENRFTFSFYHIKLVVSSMILISLVIFMVGSFGLTGQLASLKQKRTEEKRREFITSELNRLSFEMTQKLILNDGLDNKLSFDKCVKDADTLIGGKNTGSISYTLKPVFKNDTLLVITGIAGYHGYNEKFVNQDGSKGRIQVSSVIKSDADFQIISNN